MSCKRLRDNSAPQNRVDDQREEVEKHPKEREVRRISPWFAARATKHCQSHAGMSLLLSRASRGNRSRACRIVEEESDVYKHRFTGNQAS